jgi:hypothetical protein
MRPELQFSRAAGTRWPLRALCWGVLHIMKWLVARDTLRMVVTLPGHGAVVRTGPEPSLAPAIGKDAPS